MARASRVQQVQGLRVSWRKRLVRGSFCQHVKGQNWQDECRRECAVRRAVVQCAHSACGLSHCRQCDRSGPSPGEQGNIHQYHGQQRVLQLRDRFTSAGEQFTNSQRRKATALTNSADDADREPWECCKQCTSPSLSTGGSAAGP